jgi:hypothetical protein
MSHVTDIDNLQIELAALDLVPEAVARGHSVLGISATTDSLRVLIPRDQLDTVPVETLSWIVKRQIVVDTADRDAINAAINFHYPAKYADIDNCQPSFRFKCPKRWYALEATEFVAVRHCNECDQDVFLCRTKSELQVHAKAGHCVALAEEYQEPEFMGLLDITEERF